MTKLILSFIVLSTLASQNLFAKAKVLMVNPVRTITVKGPIEDLRIQSKKVLQLSEDSKKPIYITIDSYGGSVLAGVELIQAIDRAKSRGVSIRCVVTGAAMSMATHILASCDKRYALPTSLIMWHPMAINAMFIRLTEENTEQINTQLKLLSKYLDKRLRKALGISEEKYRKFEKGEYIMFAADLNSKVAPKFLTLVNDVRIKN